MADGDSILCRFDDILDGQARGFALSGDGAGGGSPRQILVVRQGDRVHGYVNSCPHAGTPLDWTPDRFISPDGLYLQCSTHGARFGITDGVCVEGPCRGTRLAPIAVAVVSGFVVLYTGD